MDTEKPRKQRCRERKKKGGKRDRQRGRELKMVCYDLLTFKALDNLALSYLSELLQPYTPSPTLRSSSSPLLSTPSACLSTMGLRAFSRSAPRLWNSLPLSIRSIVSPHILNLHQNSPVPTGISHPTPPTNQFNEYVALFVFKMCFVLTIFALF